MTGVPGQGGGLWPPISPPALVRLDRFVELLRKWNSAINLVSQNSLGAVWERHILDSVQVFRAVPNAAGLWVDLGSGAGFPGVVIAILAAEYAPGFSVTLVEGDQRKAEFLRVVSRETQIGITVIAERIEAIAPLGADIVSARALAPLSQLCAFADRHLQSDGLAVFPKGATSAEEVRAARQHWRFGLEAVPSRTDPTASILLLRGIAHV